MLSPPSSRLILVSRIFAALALFFLAGIRYQQPTWLLEQDVQIVAALFSLAFFLSIPLDKLTQNRSRSLTRRIASSFLFTALVGAAIFTYSFAADLTVSRIAMVLETAILGALLLLNYLNLDSRKIVIGNFAVFLLSIMSSLTPSSISSFKETILGVRSVAFDDSVNYVFSSRHDVKLSELAVRPDFSLMLGGGLSFIDSRRLLVGTGDGKFFVVTLEKSFSSPETAAIQSPLNRAEYVANTENPSPHFRVTDVLLEDSPEKERSLFASHHFWNENQNCLTLRLSEITIDIESMTAVDSEWKSRFESMPCLPISDGPFSNESGGRIVQLTPHSILLTVGTHRFDYQAENLADYDNSSYGKIFEIDTNDWSTRVYSNGHRNPQGLLVTDEMIWSTEHGPHGGDELNIVEQGNDYGWPRSTYGTAYGKKQWDRIVGPREHSFGTKPVFSWVPSIGVSNLIQSSGLAFPAWEGDLIIGSLIGLGNGRSLFRAKIEDERVILLEKIVTNRPVRDITEAFDGRIVLWDGSNMLQLLEPSSHIFAQCSGCHAMRWTSHGIGPDLMGVVGEKVARHSDFRYSDALRRHGGWWTTERLDEFLRNPAETVPGTSMNFPGIEDAQKRAEIIEYLTKVSSD